MSYTVSREEKKFLSEYNIERYARPSVTTDIVVFSVRNDGIREDARRLQKRALKILMVKRASYPYKDCFALPGGFLEQGEDVADCAKRELLEETNVKGAGLKVVNVFGKPNRDPRGWIVSNIFMTLINEAEYEVRAGSDAWEAEWFSIEVNSEEILKSSDEDGVKLEIMHMLKLKNEEKNYELKARIREKKCYKCFHETESFEIEESDGFAFDHADIILNAVLILRRDIKHNVTLAFDFMPEYFTLSQLQAAYEAVIGESVLKPNFRRKVSDYVLETEKYETGARHRAAKLFSRNLENIYS